MPVFEYKAYDATGAKVEGEIEGLDRTDALSKVRALDLLPSDISQKTSVESRLTLGGSGVSLKELEFLTTELSLLINSGVRIDKGIDIIRKTKAKPELGRLLNKLSISLRAGNSLVGSLREHPDIFDEFYCNLVELGESSGNLPIVFTRLSTDLKFKRALRRKIINSLSYPTVIFFVCILSIFFVFNFIVPRMSSMFDSVQDIPWYTAALLSTSQWINTNQLLLVMGAVLLVVAGYLAGKKPEVREKVSAVLSRIAFIRPFVLTIERIRFNRSLALMLESGMPIDRALELSTKNVKSKDIRKELDISRSKIKQGSSLTSALGQTELYPPFYVSLLEVGEETGTLDNVFNEISTRSHEEFESTTDKVTSLIEPLMILFMGGASRWHCCCNVDEHGVY